MFGNFIWRNQRNTQKLYKITVLKGDIRKHAKSMLNMSGTFFIASGVSLLMNGKKRKIPVAPVVVDFG